MATLGLFRHCRNQTSNGPLLAADQTEPKLAAGKAPFGSSPLYLVNQSRCSQPSRNPMTNQHVRLTTKITRSEGTKTPLTAGAKLAHAAIQRKLHRHKLGRSSMQASRQERSAADSRERSRDWHNGKQHKLPSPTQESPAPTMAKMPLATNPRRIFMVCTPDCCVLVCSRWNRFNIFPHQYDLTAQPRRAE